MPARASSSPLHNDAPATLLGRRIVMRATSAHKGEGRVVVHEYGSAHLKVRLRATGIVVGARTTDVRTLPGAPWSASRIVCERRECADPPRPSRPARIIGLLSRVRTRFRVDGKGLRWYGGVVLRLVDEHILDVLYDDGDSMRINTMCYPTVLESAAGRRRKKVVDDDDEKEEGADAEGVEEREDDAEEWEGVEDDAEDDAEDDVEYDAYASACIRVGDKYQATDLPTCREDMPYAERDDRADTLLAKEEDDVAHEPRTLVGRRLRLETGQTVRVRAWIPRWGYVLVDCANGRHSVYDLGVGGGKFMYTVLA